METTSHNLPFVILLVGTVVAALALLRTGLESRRLPPLVGYIALGIALGAGGRSGGWLRDDGRSIFQFLGHLGVICLLFHVGLSSKLDRLLREIRPAAVVWISQVTLCFVLGYAATRWVLGLPPATGVIVGVALSATSVGVAVALWEQAGLLDTRDGDLLIDIAELDDISAVVAMAVVLAVLAPLADGDGDGETISVAFSAVMIALAKIAAFTVGCLVFARTLESRLTSITSRNGAAGATLLLITGIGFVLAAVAELLGLSLAIGAFFAGLAFSRDPVAVRADASFQALYDLFVPFFFLWVGIQLDPGSLIAGVGVGCVLLAVGAAGKYWGSVLPLRHVARAERAHAIGVSMIPRAEIALLVVGAGHALGSWAVPDHVLSGMVFVTAATTIGAPLLLRRGLSPPA